MSPVSRRQALGAIGGSIGVGVFGHGLSGRASAQADSSELVWEYQTVERARIGGETTFTLSGGAVYAATAGDGDGEAVTNEMFALDAETGTVNWKKEIGNRRGRGSPKLLDGIAVFRIDDLDGSGTQFVAVDATTGDEQWTVSNVIGQPVVANGTAFVRTQGDASSGQTGTLHALDIATGDEQWRFEDSDDAAEPLSVDGEMLYATIQRDEFNLIAIDTATGTEQWAFQTDARAESLVIDTETVYVANTDVEYQVDALEASTGDQQWRFSPDVSSRPSVMVAEGDALYVGYSQERMYSLSAADGTVRWETSALVDEGLVVPRPNRVYLGGRGEVSALDATTGDEQWTVSMDAAVSNPTVVDGTVYVNNVASGNQSDGGVYALDAESGDQRWAYGMEFGTLTSPAVIDGTVVVFNGATDRVLAVQGTAQQDQPTGTDTEETTTDAASTPEDDDQTDAGEATATGRDDSGGSQETSGAAGPGFGITEVLAGVGASAYLLKQRLTSDDYL